MGKVAKRSKAAAETAAGTTKFDPAAVGRQIADHIKQADTFKAKSLEHSMSAGKLLVDIAENHKEHLDAICKTIGLGHSRRAELMQIAGGRKTAEQVKADSRERKRRSRDKEKHNPEASVTSPVTEAPPAIGNNNDPEASAKARKEEYAKADAASASKVTQSQRALAQFKVAVNEWLPKMTYSDTQAALAAVTDKVKAMAPKAAA